MSAVARPTWPETTIRGTDNRNLMDEGQSVADAIRAAIDAGIAKFRLDRPDVVVSDDTVDTLTGFIDNDFAMTTLGGNSYAEVAERTYEFLVRIADAYPEIMTSVVKKGLLDTQHESEKPDSVVIDRSSLRQARTKFWCTIYPFCKPA